MANPTKYADLGHPGSEAFLENAFTWICIAED
jgi:hypothetical protein